MGGEIDAPGPGVEGEPATVAALLAEATARLGRAGVEEAAREARLLLALSLGLDAGQLLALGGAARVDPRRFRSLLARRAEAREPMAFLSGRREFWTLSLETSRDTLIPRPDTETLVELALALRPDRGRVHRLLDLGTGTGALLLACLREFPRGFGVGTDHAGACRLARRNARANGLSGRCAFVAADWLAPLRAPAGGFDLVLSNPPYIETDAIDGLMPEVSRHEPRAALDGGPDGLRAYRSILAGLAPLLAPDGIAVLEIGLGQADAVGAVAGTAGLRVAGKRADLGGTVRALALAPGGGFPDGAGGAGGLGAARRDG